MNVFKILGQPATAIEPSESAFYGRPYNVAKREACLWGRARANRLLGNAENDLDVVLIDFDPAHDGANNLPPAVAIETVESLHDLGGEILRAADDERKIAFETGCVFSSLTPLFD
jgi:hypothetical protein